MLLRLLLVTWVSAL
ncbi:hypothetical protein LINPERPRIM_LOCUS32555 [Linum perenne]